MALDWEIPLNYNQIYPFENNQFYQFEQEQFYPFEQHQIYQDPDELLLQLEAELLCFDSAPPTLFDVDDLIIDPNPPKLDHFQSYDHNFHNHDLIKPINGICNNVSYPCIDFPPPLLLPPEENFPCEENYYTQFTPFAKKQKLSVPSFNWYAPELITGSECGGVANEVTIAENNPNYYHHHHENFNNGDVGSYNVGCTNGKTRSVSAQSRAARQRRRRITEKTQELGKLVPGGTKMNTAEMLQSAFKYVKFLQAQLGVLQVMQKLHQESDKKVNLNHLPILASQSVQEKLYANEKILVPLDLLPMFEEHCDFETNSSISQHISDLIH